MAKLQSISIPKIANDFYKIIGSNKKDSVRNARTAVTSAQNGGRQQGFNQAQELDINFKRKWLDAHVMSEINSNITKENLKHGIVLKCIGNYKYRFVCYGFDNYKIIEKIKIK